jgi:hypothetical protein
MGTHSRSIISAIYRAKDKVIAFRSRGINKRFRRITATILDVNQRCGKRLQLLTPKVDLFHGSMDISVDRAFEVRLLVEYPIKKRVIILIV